MADSIEEIEAAQAGAADQSGSPIESAVNLLAGLQDRIQGNKDEEAEVRAELVDIRKELRDAHEQAGQTESFAQLHAQEITLLGRLTYLAQNRVELTRLETVPRGAALVYSLSWTRISLSL
jgi:hypothetical protein